MQFEEVTITCHRLHDFNCIFTHCPLVISVNHKHLLNKLVLFYITCKV